MRCSPMSKGIAFAGRAATPFAKLIEGIASGSFRIPIERTLSGKNAITAPDLNFERQPLALDVTQSRENPRLKMIQLMTTQYR